jgi:hypothetical protein
MPLSSPVKSKLELKDQHLVSCYKWFEGCGLYRVEWKNDFVNDQFGMMWKKQQLQSV